MSGGLFQIAEPGESRVKEACDTGRVVGIDLGTTNSLVAIVTEGAPRCLDVDDAGGKLLPSVVAYREEGTFAGRAAQAEAAAHPRDTIVSVKRFMGRGPKDAELSRRFTPYDFGTTDQTIVKFRVAGPRGDREVTPVEVSAEILRALKARAEAHYGGDLDGVVITVPAYFDDAQRQATKDAGRLAGLEVLRLLNEPTAAALAYGLDKKKDGIFAVYDLGGGTFDVSVLKLSEGIFEVKATGGDTALGGDDFDRALAQIAEGKAGIDEASLSSSERRALLDAARATKHALTTADEATIALPGGARAVITRVELEAAIQPILARTGAPCRRALKDAGLGLESPEGGERLDGVILVGGATRVPAVRAFVKQLFGMEPLADIDPDQVVAMGAAVQADLLAGRSDATREDVLLLDVIPLSLGLEMMGGVVEKLIHRNSTIPTGAKQTFTTYADGQTGFDLHVVQGERETVDACRSLARFTLKGIPPMAAGMAQLEVTFLVDADGILKVKARELITGRESAIDVKPSYGLTDDDIERMLVESYEFAEEDVAARLLAEARVEADRIVTASRVALARDGALLSTEERAAIDQAIEELVRRRAGLDHTAINQQIEALDHASKDFAERRMNRSISAAMAGRTVADVEQKL